MKISRNNMVLFFVVFVLTTVFNLPGAVAADVEEFNPVDVMDAFYSRTKTERLPQDVNIIAGQLLSELANSHAERPQEKLAISKEIVDLLIPANIASADNKTSRQQPAIRRRLWETTIALSSDFEKKKDGTVEQLINKIKSLKFENLEQQNPVEDDSENDAIQPTEQPIACEPLKAEPAPAEAQNSTVNEGELTGEVLEKIKNNIAEIKNPHRLAEMLYRSGRFYYASICYKQALKISEIKGRPEEDAWILFQVANCLKDDNPSEAMEYYSKVIAEYPDTTWASASKQYNSLLNWQSQDRPYELIEAQKANMQEEAADE